MDGNEHRIELRAPGTVMRLARMGSFHPTRLSFMRILLRRLAEEKWSFDRPLWDVNERGVGRAIYRAKGPERTYSLVAFAHDLPDELRSDRVIAEAWDATFTLFDGEPTDADLERLEANVPLQEAGRFEQTELSLSRANRSVRLFGYVADCLAAGRQPDPEELASVGYLMRTTAVYGSAKFGLCDREVICDRPEFAAPFQVEMLSVWLTRAFTIDIVEHMARVANPAAERLDRGLRRGIGVGNSTGLGMAPFLMTHPVLINNWMASREEALRRARSAPVDAESLDHFRRALAAAVENAARWRSDHPIQIEKLAELRADLERLAGHVAGLSADAEQPWDDLWQWGQQNLGLEGQEQLVALLLEPHGALVDDLAQTMAADEASAFGIDARQTVGALRADIERDYGWALTTDWSEPPATARLWYVSAEKLEPRLADRADEPLEDYEQALAPGRDVAALYTVLSQRPDAQPIAEMLSEHPEHRYAVRRAQITSRHGYAEIMDNTIDAKMLPIDLLRAKLSFFGATRFDPRSDRWVRISMYQNAPYPDEFSESDADTWMYDA